MENSIFRLAAGVIQKEPLLALDPLILNNIAKQKVMVGQEMIEIITFFTK